MQVTHQNDHVTHAVIGGSDAIEFGMSNSAEFFHILSSTLYKDQKLAVVREVLCNAWDAHIEAGKTHIPIHITLTDEKLVVKDFGTGIHRDDMGQVYGTYGNSTKKNDGKQTGGFGLGCKAPFAYTDHFEVISAHDGVRTIYNISKSSAQAKGKPGIVPIASFPSEDTGLQVTIPMQSQDIRRFRTLITRIVRNGDMNAQLNGDSMGKIGFDTTISNYMIMQDGYIADDASPIMIRYGNVIYPVDKVADLYDPYGHIEQHLAKLNYQRSEYRIIFQAPPHSITVQPSREGLSMQEHTVKTLRGLMLDFLNTLDTSFMVECTKFAENSVTVAVKEKRISELLKNTAALPLGEHSREQLNVIADLGVMAKRYMAVNYPDTLEFRKKDITYRLLKMVDAGLLQRGVVQTWLAALSKVDTNHKHMQYADTDWLQKRVLGPLITKMTQKNIDYKRLYVYDGSDCNAPKSSYGAAKQPVVEATRVRPQHHFSTLPYLRNIVVMNRSRVDISTRAYKHDVFKQMGNYEGFLFYHIGMRKNEKDNAEAFFKAQGFVVVDLTIPFPWEVHATTTVGVTPRAAKKVGLPSLTNIRTKHNNINIRRYKDPGAVLITEPEAVVLLPFDKRSSSDCFSRWDREATRIIVDLFGDKIGVASSTTNQATWVKKGVVEFETWIRDKLFTFMKTNVNLQEYWGYDLAKAMDKVGSEKGKDLMRMMYRHEVLRTEFDLVNHMTAEEKLYLALYRKLVDSYHGRSPADILLVKAHLDAVPVQQASIDLVKLCKASPFIGMLDTEELETGIKTKNPAQISMVIKLIHSVLL